MAESSRNIDSSRDIKPYWSEPVHATGYSNSEDNCSESETKINRNRQALLRTVNDRLVQDVRVVAKWTHLKDVLWNTTETALNVSQTTTSLRWYV